MWRDGKHSNDYRFFDKTISEQFQVGGTGVLIHKYIGPAINGPTGDATQPSYSNQSETNIQDLLFLENRDRKYDPDIYTTRGIYTVADNDFDLSQFGLFLANGTIFINFHLNDMMELLGRKLMNGDVLELPHLKDYNTINDSVPIALKRYYVVSDAKWPTEGFSPTWWPHLWRVKCAPMVNGQEYKDILDQIAQDVTGNANANSSQISNIISTIDTLTTINDSIIVQAQFDVSKSGYDTSTLYTLPFDHDKKNSVSSLIYSDIGLGYFAGNAAVTFSAPQTVDGINAVGNISLFGNGAIANVTIWNPGFGYTETPTAIFTGANTRVATANVVLTVYDNPSDPRNAHPDAKIQGYLVGDGTAPNGLTVVAGSAFPIDAKVGDYFLRLDYLPNRLFRFDGNRWTKLEDSVRANLTPGPNNTTLKSSFINNMTTYTDINGNVHQGRQALNTLFKPGADN